MNWKKDHYSYSKLWTYLRSPEEYYRNYVLKQKDPPSAPMILGRMFSDIYATYDLKKDQGEAEGKKFKLADLILNPRNYYKDTPENIYFRPDKIEIIKAALSDKNLYRLAPKYCEQNVFVQGKVCGLGAKHDGRIKVKDKTLIVENKFGNPWTEERANEEDQITFYAYCDWLLTGIIPTVRVQSVNGKTGQVLAFTVRKTKKAFAPLEEKIEFAWKGIRAEKWERI